MTLRKIVSGGQTGVDRGALDAALDAGFDCGGWCPRGRLAEDGEIPARYRMAELAGAGYEKRTLKNVLDSDGTAILDFPGSNARRFLILAVISVLGLALRVAVGDGVPLTAVVFFIFGIVGYVLMSKVAREAKQQFESDTGANPAPVDAGGAA